MEPSNFPIDPVEFGKLINAVATLTTELQSVNIRLAALDQRMTFGKGMAVGLFLFAGGIGAGASKAIEAWFK